MSLLLEVPERLALPAFYPHCNAHCCRNVRQPFSLIFKRVCVYEYVCGRYVYHGICAEVRGQLIELVLSSYPVGSRDQTQAARFGASILSHQSHLLAFWCV